MCISCHFCACSELTEYKKGINISTSQYLCPRCGEINLTEVAGEDVEGEQFSEKEKLAISITLRNQYERKNKAYSEAPIELEDLRNIIKSYRPLEPLEKLDIALINIEKNIKYFGQQVKINGNFDYPYYHCSSADELRNVIIYLRNDGFLQGIDDTLRSWNYQPRITTLGYQRLRELKKNIDSQQCFVAMWFEPEMEKIYIQSIKPAIEYVEEGESTPRFKAVKIDLVDHANDINDEIISQIKRSKFMVCDLTGYRGGVYFEAGYAFGLGIPVIYTCRRDWGQPEDLKNEKGNVIEYLYYSTEKKIRIKKEGVHFDLAHRNRIEWDENGLDEFKNKLTNRIKAIIV